MIERFAQMPSALRVNARWERRGGVPCMFIHPDWESGRRVPIVIWIHGRTAHKELDPGRYLRWMRSPHGGIGTCAVDLPGHGERFDAALQERSATLRVVQQMVDEIDEIFAAIETFGVFDMQRVAIGGMSAGGMVTLARLCRDHSFQCASVEATTGSWRRTHEDLEWNDREIIEALNPAQHLNGWREIPLQAIHAQEDELIRFEDQRAFIQTLRVRYADGSMVELIAYERTGAPSEHIGFGRFAADAKDRQRAFFNRWLLPA